MSTDIVVAREGLSEPNRGRGGSVMNDRLERVIVCPDIVETGALRRAFQRAHERAETFVLAGHNPKQRGRKASDVRRNEVRTTAEDEKGDEASRAQNPALNLGP